MGYEGPVGMEALAKGDPETAPEAFRAACTFGKRRLQMPRNPCSVRFVTSWA
ncbi:hypothetical protein MAA8898_02734 [Maliponia aquimaris]|uniref:Uncharacterized protein n=1 Tax=Maliponia aquimaris TaxID=1673631 RepID=A0A238KK52_9RHOB|nr:hypothetical protein MAA8898_02734 [Maliponia aquimaris]